MTWRLAAGALLVALATVAVTGCEPAHSTGRIREVEMPRGYVDVPADGSIVDGEILIEGWALAEDGIEDVAIYANGRYVDSAVLGGARPDVARAEAGRQGAAISGFRVLLPAHRLPAGEVTLVVQARTRKGATRDLRAVPVFVPSP
jgi:hypothetical protein